MSNAVKMVVKMVVPYVVHHLLRKILDLPVDCSIVIFDFAGLVHTIYNGGQKWWSLSSDISKAGDPSPPTPSKVEF